MHLIACDTCRPASEINGCRLSEEIQSWKANVGECAFLSPLHICSGSPYYSRTSLLKSQFLHRVPCSLCCSKRDVALHIQKKKFVKTDISCKLQPLKRVFTPNCHKRITSALTTFCQRRSAGSILTYASMLRIAMRVRCRKYRAEIGGAHLAYIACIGSSIGQLRSRLLSVQIKTMAKPFCREG